MAPSNQNSNNAYVSQKILLLQHKIPHLAKLSALNSAILVEIMLLQRHSAVINELA